MPNPRSLAPSSLLFYFLRNPTPPFLPYSDTELPGQYPCPDQLLLLLRQVAPGRARCNGAPGWACECAAFRVKPESIRVLVWVRANLNPSESVSESERASRSDFDQRAFANEGCVSLAKLMRAARARKGQAPAPALDGPRPVPHTRGSPKRHLRVA